MAYSGGKIVADSDWQMWHIYILTQKEGKINMDCLFCKIINGDIPYAVHGWNKDFKDFEEMKRFLEEQKVWEPNQ